MIIRGGLKALLFFDSQIKRIGDEHCKKVACELSPYNTHDAKQMVKDKKKRYIENKLAYYRNGKGYLSVTGALHEVDHCEAKEHHRGRKTTRLKKGGTVFYRFRVSYKSGYDGFGKDTV